jgi:hypothetical protein
MIKIDFLHSCSVASIMVLASVSLSGLALAQNAAGTTVNTRAPRSAVDPGVRGGAPGAGGPLPGLNPVEQAFFNAATGTFAELETVPTGLGPRFNLDSCGGCHAQPASGGSSPPTNPQVAVATAKGVSYRRSSPPTARFARRVLSATRMEHLTAACTTCL